MKTCSDYGLKDCPGCIRKKLGSPLNKFGTRCWIDEYRKLVKDWDIRSMIVENKIRVPLQSQYLIAALREYPEKLAVYEKLMVLK